MRPIHALVTALAPILALTVAPDFAGGTGKVKCADEVSPVFRTVDPIVNHNQVGANHEHQFFGAVGWLSRLKNPNTATYSDLAGRATNCRITADTAGYWTPSLAYTSGPHKGKRVPVRQFTAYYRAFNDKDFGPGRAFPPGTRLIGSRYNWTCGERSGARSNPVQSIPNCSGLSGKAGRTLTAHISFPSCWDGVRPSHGPREVGDTQDTKHYAFPTRDGRRGKCPSAFPIEMTRLKETIQFSYVGRGDNVGLSSDPMHGVSDGRSLHGDFWNTWDQTFFVNYIKDCVTSRTSYTKAKCQPEG